MSREIEGLPSRLMEALGRTRDRMEPDLGVMVCSVDDEGVPHPMMLSPLEIVAVDPRTLRIAAYADSRSTRYLGTRGHVTLMFVDAGMAVYVKGVARRLPPHPLFPHLARFAVYAVTVLEDATDAHVEGHAAIESGIRVRRPHVEAEEARALLGALLE